MQRTLQLGVRLCFSHARRPRLVFGGPLGLGRGAGVVGGGARARGRAVWRRRRGGGLQDGHLAMAVPGSFPCSSRWRIRGRLGRSGDFRRSRAVSVGVFSVRVRRFPRKDGGVGREKLGQFGLVQGNGTAASPLEGGIIFRREALERLGRIGKRSAGRRMLSWVVAQDDNGCEAAEGMSLRGVMCWGEEGKKNRCLLV